MLFKSLRRISVDVLVQPQFTLQFTKYSPFKTSVPTAIVHSDQSRTLLYANFLRCYKVGIYFSK